MEIRSRSESVSRERGREGGKRKRQNGRDGWREEKRGESQQMYHDAREITMQTRRSFTKPLAQASAFNITIHKEENPDCLSGWCSY